MAKSLFVGTVPATISVIVEAKDEESASEAIKVAVRAALGSTLGVISIIGEPKVASMPIAGKKAKVDDKEEEDDEEEEEEEKPAPKKTDKKPVKDDGKKKIKIKLKG